MRDCDFLPAIIVCEDDRFTIDRRVRQPTAAPWHARTLGAFATSHAAPSLDEIRCQFVLARFSEKGCFGVAMQRAELNLNEASETSVLEGSSGSIGSAPAMDAVLSLDYSLHSFAFLKSETSLEISPAP
jgi:hypothetical protein